MSRYIKIVEWNKYQHYKDRNPPWIKLHRELLTSLTWVETDTEGRVLAIAIMMLAAATDNKIPAREGYIKRVAYLDFTPDLEPLIKLGFIEIIEEIPENASNVQATARPETETEAYKEIDKSISKRSSKKDEIIPPDKPREKPDAKRGKRIETEFGEDWQIPEKYLAYARGKQFPKSEIETEFEKFCNHWRAKSGKDATKCDWFATWRNWILNAGKWRGGNGGYSGNRNGRGETSILDLTAEIIAERGGGDARDYD